MTSRHVLAARRCKPKDLISSHLQETCGPHLAASNRHTSLPWYYRNCRTQDEAAWLLICDLCYFWSPNAMIGYDWLEDKVSEAVNFPHKSMQKQSDTSHESNFFRYRTWNESPCGAASCMHLCTREWNATFHKFLCHKRKKCFIPFNITVLDQIKAQMPFPAFCAFLLHPLLPLWAAFKSTGLLALY